MLLAMRFLQDFATHYDIEPPGLQKDEMTALMAHEWQGNVRELRNVIEQSIQAHAGRMDDVAHDLGIGRRTLNEKIVKLGLDKNALL